MDLLYGHVQTVKTGRLRPDGREEELTEYLCDWSGCANVAVHVLGCVKELVLPLALCVEHATTSRSAAHD
jgi:hypothetical protein